MKVTARFGITLLTLLLGTTAYLSGCATMRMGKPESEKTAMKVETTETTLKQTLAQVDATQASLDNLLKPGQADMKKQFDTYSDNVKKTDKMAKQLENDQAKMQEQQATYLADWEKREISYTDPSLKQASAQRRAALSAAYNEIPKQNTKFRDALNAYLSEVKQIQSQLSLDLTSKGIEAVTPAAEKARDDRRQLHDMAEPVITAMDRARQEMSSEHGAAAGGGGY